MQLLPAMVARIFFFTLATPLLQNCQESSAPTIGKKLLPPGRQDFFSIPWPGVSSSQWSKREETGDQYSAGLACVGSSLQLQDADKCSALQIAAYFLTSLHDRM